MNFFRIFTNLRISEKWKAGCCWTLRTHANTSVISNNRKPQTYSTKNPAVFFPLDWRVQSLGTTKQLNVNREIGPPYERGKRPAIPFGRDVETHILRNTSSTTSKDQQLCVFQANLRVCRWKLCKRALCYVRAWRFSRTSRANVSTMHISFLQAMCWSVFRTLGALKMTVNAGCWLKYCSSTRYSMKHKLQKLL